jgi:flavin reductase (DIM6/NTAB) family NADH-FMN oxidoreductase RutF
MNFAIENEPSDALKAVFRRHASGVSVITMNGENQKPVGFTATSMTSLGSTPALASFNVASGSASWGPLNSATHVAIHTLSIDSVELAKKMAAPHELRFLDDDWQRGPHDLPIFREASGVLIAKIREIHSIEANAVVIVEIEQGLIGAECDPLVYHQRAYKTAVEVN